MQTVRAVKGMNDILPSEVHRWQEVERVYREHTGRYGFSEVRTPILEPTPLFVRGIGDTTDIVEKEMYSFVDKGEKSLTMRPEGTASAVRAYIQHQVGAKEPVSKWIYLGPMYRRERPAKGRYRQFYQLGAEVFGDPGPFVDAEVIAMLVGFFGRLGIADVKVVLNSLGSGDTRERFRAALVEYLTPRLQELSADSQARLERNPLRILDSKDPKDQEVAKDAPPLSGFLSDEDTAHFSGVKSALSRLGVPFEVDQGLVRGLDYYSRTLFEVKDQSGNLGAQDTLCGGGRYDSLVRSLGGGDTPAIGFAIGMERLLLSLGEADVAHGIDAFVASTESGLTEFSLEIAEGLRARGLNVDTDLRGNSLKSQMRRANKSGARFAIILGEAEKERGVAQARDLNEQTQAEVPLAKLFEHIDSVVNERKSA